MENKPSDKLKIELSGENHELFMSYGLLTRLSRILTNADEALEGSMNADLRDNIVRESLVKKGRSGVIDASLEEIDMDEIEISLDDIENLIQWGTGHVLAFFMRQMEAAGKTVSNLVPEMPEADQTADSVPTENGSKD